MLVQMAWNHLVWVLEMALESGLWKSPPHEPCVHVHQNKRAQEEWTHPPPLLLMLAPLAQAPRLRKPHSLQKEKARLLARPPACQTHPCSWWMKPWRLCMIMVCPLCMLWSMEWSICGVNKKSKGPKDKGARSGIWADGARMARVCAGVEMGGAGAVEEEWVVVFGVVEVVGTSDLLPLAFLGPLNVTVGSSRFQ